MESQKIEYKEYPHSKNLAFAFYKAGFIESWGRGWKKICDGFVAAGLPKPTIESKQGGVLVTFQRNNVNIPKQKPIDAQNVAESAQENSQKTQQKTQQKIVTLIENNPQITTQEMADSIGIDRSNVYRNIKKLQEQGIILRVGPDKGGHWEVITPEKKG